MSILTQKTISKKISVEGIGIHTGLEVKLDILPAHPNTGIVFKRVDIKKNNIVIPSYNNVIDAALCTTISNEFGIKISTIEHLMGAFYGLGIDNAIVEINSQEVPIMDGSAKQFVELILEAGIQVSESPIKLIKIENEVEIQEGNKMISIKKSNVSLDIDFEIVYRNSLLKLGSDDKLNLFQRNKEDVKKYKEYENISEIILFASKGYEKSMSFDHNLLDEIDDHIEKMIAGNIKIEDVTNFKNKHYILDVSGSLESSKGVKDINKIDKFLNTVHNISS